MSTKIPPAPEEWVIVTDEKFMHMRITQIYHRRYPEVRGEGRSLGEASRHLTRRLASAREQALGSGRALIEQAIADIRAIRSPRPRSRSEVLTTVP